MCAAVALAPPGCGGGWGAGGDVGTDLFMTVCRQRCCFLTVFSLLSAYRGKTLSKRPEERKMEAGPVR